MEISNQDLLMFIAIYKLRSLLVVIIIFSEKGRDLTGDFMCEISFQFL